MSCGPAVLQSCSQFICENLRQTLRDYYITNLKTYTENTEKSQRHTELRNQISVALCGSRWNSV